MKQGIGSYEALREEVDRRARCKVDIVADVRDVEVSTDGGGIRFKKDIPIDHAYWHLHGGHALEQMFSHYGIPISYLRRIEASESKTLIAKNLNHWFQNRNDDRANRMFRCTTDGSKVTAFLSDQYGRLDDEMVMDSLDPVLDSISEYELGSCNVNDRYFNLKILLPKLQEEVKVGQIVRGGFMASNCSIGLGTLDFTRFWEVVMCKNGMVGYRLGDGVHRIHRSIRLPVGILPQYWNSSVPMAHDIVEDLREVVTNCTSEEGFKGYIKTMRDATEGEKVRYLDRISDNLKTIPAVEWLGDKFNLTSAVKVRITNAFLSTGDYSKWGFVNGITNAANDHPDYDEATQLEELGGRILQFNNSQWSDIAHAEYRKAA